MEYRGPGETGWRVSTISMGGRGIGGQWGPVAEAGAIRTVHAALDLGVNLFDTADAHGSRVSEELVGKARRGRRDGVSIATKVGNFGRRQGAPPGHASPLHVELCRDASPGRMKLDAIDLYQCHIGDLQEPSIFLGAFERLVERGEVRAHGVSTDSLAVARAFNRDGGRAAVQLKYSLLNRAAERDLPPWCAANGVGALPRGPRAQGVLAGKFTPGARFDDRVRAGWNAGPGREQFLRRLEQVEQLCSLGRPDRTLARAAPRWTLANPAVTCAIPGAKDVARMTSKAGAVAALSEGELERLDAVLARW